MERKDGILTLVGLIFVVFFGLQIFFCGPALSASATFSVKDQYGNKIGGSSIWVINVGVFSTETTVDIPVGSFDVVVIPGINGYPGNNLVLGRLEHLEVSTLADPMEVTYEWITTPVKIDIVDQNGKSIPHSRVDVFSLGIGTYVASGFTPIDAIFPVTDSNVYPTISGYFVQPGFDVAVMPGQNESQGDTRLLGKMERITQVTPTSPSKVTYQWETTQVTIDVVDQNGQPIPGSGAFIWNPELDAIVAGGSTTPFTVTLPITDTTVNPDIVGYFAQRGYDVVISPGINTYSCWGCGMLSRAGNTMKVSPSTNSVNFEWIENQCPVQVVDSSGNNVPGSTFTFEWGATYNTGEYLNLPITDNTVYPLLEGRSVDGYYLSLKPGDTTDTGDYQFEVLPGGFFEPQFVTIGGRSYGLRCQGNEPPIANAGGNISILSDQQSSTFIMGTGSDKDVSDILTYRWLEGTTILQGWMSVQGGICPLNLASLPQLSVGNHTFTLEVSDQQVTAQDTMMLLVENSPPVVACGGGIRAEINSPFQLNAAVADFDGDSLFWSWKETSIVYGSGTAYPVKGGTPQSLPTTLIPGGLPLGLHSFVLTADDGVNPSVSCSISVNIIDDIPPRLNPGATPAILWPPNHQMVDVVIQTNATDNSGQPVNLSVVQILSTDNPDKDKDGNTIPDWKVVDIDQQNGIIYLQLRSERSGKGLGRTYTITIAATDSSGNTATANIQIKAPHDKGK